MPSGLDSAFLTRADSFPFVTVGVPLYEKSGFKLIREPIRGGPDKSMIVSTVSHAFHLPSRPPLSPPQLYPMERRPLLLTRANSSQLSAIAAIHRTAFAPTLWFKSLWGNCSSEAFDAWFVEKGRGWLEGEGKGEHLIVSMRGEDVLGYALWEEKEGPEQGEVEAEKNWPEGTNVEVADGFNRDMHKYTSTIKGRYWRELVPFSRRATESNLSLDLAQTFISLPLRLSSNVRELERPSFNGVSIARRKRGYLSISKVARVRQALPSLSSLGIR